MTTIQVDHDAQLAKISETLTGISERIQTEHGSVREELQELRAKYEEASSFIEVAKKKVADEEHFFAGLEYDREGTAPKKKASLWRMMQLVAHRCSQKGDRRVWDLPELGFEREVLERSSQWTDTQMPEQRTQNTASAGEGGFFMPTSLASESVFPELEAMSIAGALGSPVITGLGPGIHQWIYQKSGPTAYYVNTEGEEAITESTSTWDLIKTAPHWVAAVQKYTWQALTQTAQSMEAFARQDFARKLVLREDLSYFVGQVDGAKSTPKGLYHYAQGTGDRQVRVENWASATGGSNQNVSDLGRAMIYDLVNANTLAGAGSLGWAAEPAVSQEIGDAKDADGRPLFLSPNDGLLERFLGYPMQMSTQLTNTDDTTDKRLAFGDWSQFARIRYGNLQIDAGEEGEDYLRLRTSLRAVMGHDFAMFRPEAFTVATNFDTISA